MLGFLPLLLLKSESWLSSHSSSN
uniref:Uncharacterized protein n=1 Tax=Arundo donax TaxID=35708 RepID=A0A0A8ZIH0_ARUDO